MSTKNFGKHYPALARSRERERTLMILSCGLAISLFIIFLVVLNYKSSASAKQDVVVSPHQIDTGLGTVSSIAPDRFVKAGTHLSEVRFREVFWPRSQMPEGVVLDQSELTNMYARVDLPEGMPISRRNLTNEPSFATLPVTPGNRAVPIRLDDVASQENHFLPGTRVDVVLTYHENRELISKVIVHDARVLSNAGDTTPGHERGPVARTADRRASVRGAGVRGTTITVDVAPQDALAIRTAEQMGTLSLIMRSQHDGKAPAVSEFSATDFNTGRRSREPQKPTCSRGRVRIDGREYVVDCDGNISQVVNPFEP